MKTQVKIAILIGTIGMAFSNATNAQVIARHDNSVNFRNYHTYTWDQPEIGSKNPIYNNELVNNNIKENIDGALIAKGLKQDNANPDIRIKYVTFVENDNNKMANYGYPMMGFCFSRMMMPFGGYYGKNSLNDYKRGTLIIEAFDSQTNKLVWNGAITASLNPQKLDKAIAKGVTKIMRKYPVDLML